MRQIYGKINFNGQEYLLFLQDRQVFYQVIYRVEVPHTNLIFLCSENRYQSGLVEWDLIHGPIFVPKEDIAIAGNGVHHFQEKLFEANEISLEALKEITPQVVSLPGASSEESNE